MNATKTKPKQELPVRVIHSQLFDWLQEHAPNILFTYSGYEQAVKVMTYAEALFDVGEKEQAIKLQTEFAKKLDYLQRPYSDPVDPRLDDSLLLYDCEGEYDITGPPIPKTKVLLHWDRSRFGFGIMWFQAIYRDHVINADGMIIEQENGYKPCILSEQEDIHPMFWKKLERRYISKTWKSENGTEKHNAHWTHTTYEYAYQMNGGLLFNNGEAWPGYAWDENSISNFWSIHT